MSKSVQKDVAQFFAAESQKDAERKRARQEAERKKDPVDYEQMSGADFSKAMNEQFGVSVPYTNSKAKQKQHE